MKKDFTGAFKRFLKEIKSLNTSVFKDINNWTLCNDVENGINIPYEIESDNDRLFLHEISQKHGLIAFCPNDLLGIEYESNNDTVKQFVVRSRIGPLKIGKKS